MRRIATLAALAVPTLLAAGLGAPAAMAADDCVNAAVREQQGSSYLPQCRAYEKVSPDDKAGAGVNGIVGPYASVNIDVPYFTEDGSAVYFEANNAFGDALAGYKGFFVARRSADGWATTTTTPPFANRLPSGTADLPTIQDKSDDLSRTVFTGTYPYHADDQGVGNRRVSQSIDAYRQEVDGSMTWLSPGLTLPDTSLAEVKFAGASRDVSRVLLWTPRRLTTEVPDETRWHLYLYVDGQPTRLVDRDTGANGGAPMEGGTNFLAYLPVALSPAGSHVVFRDVANATTYLREYADDPVRARTVLLDDVLRQGTGGRTCAAVTNVSTDLVVRRGVVRFDCSTQLTDEPLSGGTGTYERQLETGALRLLGPAELAPEGPPEFFETTAALVPEDQNGVSDVYQRIDGVPHLISSGTGSQPAGLVGATPDGQTVFFTTANSLTPDDTDGGVIDMYVARIDGGFVLPEAVPECRLACQGPAVAVPGAPLAASVSFVGAGNLLEPAAAAPLGKLSVTKAKPVKGTAATVSVKLPAKGSVRVSGSGLAATSKTVAKAGSVRLTVRLSARSRTVLQRKGRLSLKATVRFAPAIGAAQTQRVSLTFTRKAKKQGTSRAGAAQAATNGKGGR